MVGRTRSFGVWNGASPTLVSGFLGEAGVLNQHPADSEEEAPAGCGGQRLCGLFNLKSATLGCPPPKPGGQGRGGRERGKPPKLWEERHL